MSFPLVPRLRLKRQAESARKCVTRRNEKYCDRKKNQQIKACGGRRAADHESQTQCPAIPYLYSQPPIADTTGRQLFLALDTGD